MLAVHEYAGIVSGVVVCEKGKEVAGGGCAIRGRFFRCLAPNCGDGYSRETFGGVMDQDRE